MTILCDKGTALLSHFHDVTVGLSLCHLGRKISLLDKRISQY